MVDQNRDPSSNSDSQVNSGFNPVELERILDELDAPQQVRSLAIELATGINDSMWAVGKRKSTIAATSVYLAGRAAGENYTQSRVASKAEVSNGTVSRWKTDFLEAYLDIKGEEAPPTVSELDP